MILLETERLLIRDWVPDDWKRYQPLATDPRVLRYIGCGEPSPEDRIKPFVLGGIEKANTRGWILWPVIHREDAELIGFCGFADGFPPDVEIGWRLRPEYWGQGLATEIASAVMEYGWRRFQFDRLIAVIQPANRASVRVAEKLGMSLETSFVHQGIEVLRYAKNRPLPGIPGLLPPLIDSHSPLKAVNLEEKLSRFSDYWSPKIVGELNGQQVKLVKLLGEFIWHRHDHEDELFLVLKGRLRIEFRGHDVWLKEGEFLIVPRGVEHRPVAEDEAQVVLFEPASTMNTGNVGGERTVARLDRI